MQSAVVMDSIVVQVATHVTCPPEPVSKKVETVDTSFQAKSQLSVGLTLANVVDIINGIFQGIGTDLQYKDVASCINDVITLGTDIVDAVQDFEKGDASSVEAGIKAIGYALEGIPTDITDCKAAYSEAAESLKEMIAVFKDPESFFFEIAKHLIVNHHEIYTEMSTAITDFKAANYEGFGKGLGEALLAVVA